LNPLYIVWQNQHSVGVPILDEQHHAIIATINSLYYFIQEGWGLSALKPTLSIIVRYSKFHAKTEEGMLTKSGYPAVIHQIEKQENFELNVQKAFDEAILHQDPNILLKFLRKWWVDHLETDHIEYAPYLAKLR
jgi:hemerythrin